MATDTERLVLQLEAQTRSFEKALQHAAGEADRAARRIERRFAEQNAHVIRGFQRFQGQATGIIAAIGVGALVRDVVTLGDKWTRTGNALATAGVEASQLAAVQDVIADIAIRTNTELESTAGLFSRLFRASGDLGANMEQVLTATELVNKALSGAGQSERASVVTQFGQGLSSGRFQGDELRSVLENSRPIAEAIAREFDTTIGNLRELGKQGELAADRVLRAVLNAAPEIEAAFARTNVTVADSFTRLETQMARYVGTNETTSGSTRALAQLIQFVSENFEALADATVIAATVLAGSFAGLAVARASQALIALAANTGRARVAFSAFFGGVAGFAITALGGALAYAAVQSNLFANSAEAAARANDTLYNALNVLANLEPVTEDQAETVADLATATRDVAEMSERAATAIDQLSTSSGDAAEPLSTQERLTRALAQAQLEQARATLEQARAAQIARIETIQRDAFLNRFGAGFMGRRDEPGSPFELTDEERDDIAERQRLIGDFNAGLQAIDESRARLRDGALDGSNRPPDLEDPNTAGARQTIADLQRQAQLALARLHHEEQRVRELEDAEAIEKRTAAYIASNLSATEARATAEAEVGAERQAMNVEAQRSFDLSQLQHDIDLQRLQNNVGLADAMSDQLDIARQTREIAEQQKISEESAAEIARQRVEERRAALN